MTKHTILIFIFSLLGQLSFAQKQQIELDIHNRKVDYFINLEKKIGSEKFNTEQEYINEGQVAQPEIFKRKEQNLSLGWSPDQTSSDSNTIT